MSSEPPLPQPVPPAVQQTVRELVELNPVLTRLGEHRGELHQVPHGLLDGRRHGLRERTTRGLDGHDQPE